MSLREDNSEETERTWGQREREREPAKRSLCFFGWLVPNALLHHVRIGYQMVTNSWFGRFYKIETLEFFFESSTVHFPWWVSLQTVSHLAHVEIATHNSHGDSSTSWLNILQVGRIWNGRSKRWSFSGQVAFEYIIKAFPNSTFLHKDSQFRKQLHSLKMNWCWWLKTRSTWFWLFMQRSRVWWQRKTSFASGCEALWPCWWWVRAPGWLEVHHGRRLLEGNNRIA